MPVYILLPCPARASHTRASPNVHLLHLPAWLLLHCALLARHFGRVNKPPKMTIATSEACTESVASKAQ